MRYSYITVADPSIASVTREQYKTSFLLKGLKKGTTSIKMEVDLFGLHDEVTYPVYVGTQPESQNNNGNNNNNGTSMGTSSRPELRSWQPHIASNPFGDVSDSGKYYYNSVYWAVDNGITAGVGNNNFGPNQVCSRAQIVTFLSKCVGYRETGTFRYQEFSDVPLTSYFAGPVRWAVWQDITAGIGNGQFGSNNPCTRAQIVTFLWKTNRSPRNDGNTGFSDVPSDKFYAQAVKWAVANGITSGTGNGQFSPNAPCTRAQCVTFLYKAFSKYLSY